MIYNIMIHDMLKDEIERSKRLESVCIKKIATFPDGKMDERDEWLHILQRTRQDISAMESVVSGKTSGEKLSPDSPFRDLVQENIELLVRANKKDSAEISQLPNGKEAESIREKMKSANITFLF